MRALTIFSFILVCFGIMLLLNLTPERITYDVLRLIARPQSIRNRVRIAQGKKKSQRFAKVLLDMQEALEVTGNGTKFGFVCAGSVVLFVAGNLLGIAIDNVYIAPVLGVACCLIPFIYAKSILSQYEKHIDLELETTLSIISSSYSRSDDIVTAVRENLNYIRPPLNEFFSTFVAETMLINPDIKAALLRLRSKTNNNIFQEWCDALIQCQDDRTMKDTLYPIVAKLTDVRIVNNELSTMLEAVRMEYYAMVALLIGNIPLMYFLNKDWYYTLMNSAAGKITLAVCGVVILVTAALMLKFTKPIKYHK